MRETLKVGVSGVRGIVGDSFTPQLAAGFAQAFGTFVGRGMVLVGRDTRLSGPMIEQAVVAGLQSVGCKPVLAGVVPTPTMLFLTRQRLARGGIVITASHNPVDWNALKFIDNSGLFLSPARAEELFDIYHQQDFPLVTESDIPGVVNLAYPTEDHFKKVMDYVDTAAIRRRKIKVAVDCCNGVGAIHTPLFLRSLLGCEVVPVFDTPSGLFEREPEPLAANLSRLCETVVQQHCDVGFAQDPDGDRLAIVDERGRPLGEDMTLGLVALQVLDAHGRGPVAVNLTASRAIVDAVKARGCEVIPTMIGEVNVTQAMLHGGAVVGGEHTGGVIVPAIHPCRDSYAGMSIVLERMAMRGESVSALRNEIPSYHVARDKVPASGVMAQSILRSIRHHYAQYPQNLMDGVFLDFGDAWVHLRRSNTEPVMRISVEARTAEAAQARALEFKQFIESAR